MSHFLEYCCHRHVGLALVTAFLVLAMSATAPASTMEYSVDRPGMDYNSFWMTYPNPAICRNRCGAEPKCRAWTYVKPGIQGAQARCWLKNSVPPKVANPCCVSGRKASAPAMRVYHNPRISGGYRLDWCLIWTQQCGKPAADEFCRRRGFVRASTFVMAPDIGLQSPTKVITSGQICNQQFCDGFKRINCVR